MQFLEAERAISLPAVEKVFNEKSPKNVEKIQRYLYILNTKKSQDNGKISIYQI